MSEIANRIVKSLNEMLELDERMVIIMKGMRFECNKAMLGHSTVKFLQVNDLPMPVIGLMGVLNSVLDPGEYIVMDRESLPDGKIIFRIVNQDTEPDVYANALKFPEDQLDNFVSRIVPVHGGLMVTRTYTKGANGKYSMVKSIQPVDPNDPVIKQARELAEANPDKAVFGASLAQKDGPPIVMAEVLPIDMKELKGAPEEAAKEAS